MSHLFRIPRDLPNHPSVRKLAAELSKTKPTDDQIGEKPHHVAERIAFRLWAEVAYTSESSGMSGFIPIGDAALIERSLLESPCLRRAISCPSAGNERGNPVFGLLIECGMMSRTDGGFFVKLFHIANPELQAGFVDSSRVGRSKAAVKKVRLASGRKAQSDLSRLRPEVWRRPDGTRAENAAMFHAMELIRSLDCLLRRPEREPEALEPETICYALDVVGKYSQVALTTVFQRLHFLRTQGKLPSSTELSLKNFDHLLLEIAPVEGWNSWAKTQKNT